MVNSVLPVECEIVPRWWPSGSPDPGTPVKLTDGTKTESLCKRTLNLAARMLATVQLALTTRYTDRSKVIVNVLAELNCVLMTYEGMHK